MKLYHGTSADVLPKILKKGLLPRGRRRGNWVRYPSNPDMVYLTDTQAFQFGPLAARTRCSAVLEIDPAHLDASRFYPDEEFIRMLLAGDKPHQQGRFNQRALGLQKKHRAAWRDSLKVSNACGYRGVIPPQAICRVCIVDWWERLNLWHLYHDEQYDRCPLADY